VPGVDRDGPSGSTARWSVKTVRDDAVRTCMAVQSADVVAVVVDTVFTSQPTNDLTDPIQPSPWMD